MGTPGQAATAVVAGDAVLGIDLGTSKTCVAVTNEAGRARLLADSAGRRFVPSYVSFREDGHVLVGDEAVRQLAADPTNTLHGGLHIFWRTVEHAGGQLGVADVDAILLDHVRRIADGALGIDSRRVVVSCPASADMDERKQLRDACVSAGLDLQSLVPDPVAAALAAGLDRQAPKLTAVYDFGGGKFECSLVEVREGIPELLGVAGDPTLGGDDLDHRIADGMLQAFANLHRIDLSGDPRAVARLVTASEEAKRELSDKVETHLRVDDVAKGPDGRPIHLRLTLSRALLIERIQDLLERSIALCDEALRQAGLPTSRVAEVLAIGGCTRIPWVQERLAAHFGRRPSTLLNPEEAVALGAALFGARESAAVSIARRVTAPYGAATSPPPVTDSPSGGVPVLAQLGQRVGRVATKKMFTAAMSAVNAPDVEYTSARPALIEVTASSLRVSTVGGFSDEILAAQSPVPVQQTRIFSTGKDNQETVKISICQGDSRRVAENVALGTILLPQLPPRPRGQVRIAVTFAIDADGVLQASAADEQSGAAQVIRVQLPG